MERTLQSKIAVSLGGLALIASSLVGCTPVQTKPETNNAPVVDPAVQRIIQKLSEYPIGTMLKVPGGYWEKDEDGNWIKYDSKCEREEIATVNGPPDELVSSYNTAKVYPEGFPENNPCYPEVDIEPR